MNPKPDPKIAEPAAGYAGALERAADTGVDLAVAASFEEFAELDEESAELEIAPPSAEVKAVAERILTTLTREFPRYYMVAPDEGGKATIEVSAGAGKGCGVLIICDDTGVACFVTMKGANRRARYDHEAAKTFPDEFVRSALRELDQAHPA